MAKTKSRLNRSGGSIKFNASQFYRLDDLNTESLATAKNSRKKLYSIHSLLVSADLSDLKQTNTAQVKKLVIELIEESGELLSYIKDKQKIFNYKMKGMLCLEKSKS